ncbi:MAG TPA: hypothetical protein VEY33_11690 [Gemmatimonadota bacterium]|nr:hypothetical protein [Gemmatimonadota bacterium]
MSPRAQLAILGLLAVTAPARGQSSAEVPPADPVVAAVRAATARYQDPAAAEEEGYRRIGPDIPAMGEHWVQVAMLLDPAVDVERPEILTYVPVDGRPRLVGVAWAVALQGDDAPPLLHGVEAPWHAHDGPVEEELLQVGHAGHGAETGSRVAVLHAWVWTPSPAGTYAAENWALPALRLGLPPEAERNDEAARALSLARGGHAFLGRQVALLAKLDDHTAAETTGILADAGAAVDAVLTGVGPEGLASGDRLDLVAIWREARERVAAAAGPDGASMVRAILGQGSDLLGLRAERRCGWSCGASIGALGGAVAGVALAVGGPAFFAPGWLVAGIPTVIGAGIGAVIASRNRETDNGI